MARFTIRLFAARKLLQRLPKASRDGIAMSSLLDSPIRLCWRCSANLVSRLLPKPLPTVSTNPMALCARASLTTHSSATHTKQGTRLSVLPPAMRSSPAAENKSLYARKRSASTATHPAPTKSPPTFRKRSVPLASQSNRYNPERFVTRAFDGLESPHGHSSHLR